MDAADRYDRLMRAVFTALAEVPDRPGSSIVARVPGVFVFPLRLGRALIAPAWRVGRPRHLVVYRVGQVGVVEIMGLAHDRMLLSPAVRRMRRQAGP